MTHPTEAEIIEMMADALQASLCGRLGLNPIHPIPEQFIDDAQAALSAIHELGIVVVPKTIGL